MTSLSLIYNPAAGGVARDFRLRAAVNEMEKLGARVRSVPTTGPGSATELARDEIAAGATRIVVAGGDGTINEAVNGFDTGRTELAIIPAGTANVLAIELGIPFNTRGAARIAVKAKATPMDLGVAGDRYFTLMAGIGFDALSIKNLNPVLKKTMRQAAFPISGVKTFIKEELPLLRIAGPGVSTEGYFVVASNSRYYGGRFGPNPEASITDGLLDVCVLKEKNLPGMLNFWFRALTSATLEDKGADYYRVSEFMVECPSRETVLVQTDGDVTGELPMKFSVLPKGLQVCKGPL
ncbi:MAG: diacylglycerol kinase family lipid kinase [Thermoleophilia bacterium]|nr:diacylglycerol kinase family lipid kinase [Thermoleophilia bacterium]